VPPSDRARLENSMTRPSARAQRAAALGCMAMLLGGCATTAERHPGDPFEPANRGVFAFNDGVDRAVLRPTARGYQKVTPDWFRTGVGNFFTNLSTPGTIVNQLLQGKIVAAGQDTLRFVLNSTIGLAGLLDPASDANLPIHDEDLGQTLGRWGVPAGPYVMLPMLGPATVRDLPSKVVDRFLEPLYWFDLGNERWFALALDLVDTRARLLPLDATLARAFDRYAFIRNAYLQRRLYQVWDGNVPEKMMDEPLEDPGDMEDPGDAEPEAPPPDQPR
jgi:phospholipid-binding lipoprotein MlaA